jgi:O-antigen/teichoic acid export membrane protein
VAAAVLGFFLTVIIVRLLGATESGYYFLMISLVTIFATLIRHGFDRVVTKEVAASQANNRWIHINGLYQLAVPRIFIFSLLVIFILFSFSDQLVNGIFSKPQLLSVWDVMLWAILPYSLYMIHGFFFQGLRRMSVFMLSQNLGLSLVLLCLVGFFWLFDQTFSAVSVGFLYVAASFIVLAVLVILWWVQPQVKISKALNFSEYSGATRIFLVVQSLNMIVAWSAPILLGVWATVDEVAIFSAAFRTAMLTSAVLMAINSIATPKFAALYDQKDMQGLHQVAIWSTRLMMIMSAPVVGVLLFLPEWVMGFFGSEFLVGSSVLAILAVGQLVNVATGSVGSLLSMTGNEGSLLKSTMIAAVIMLVLCVCLIPAFGIIGAAWSHTISLSVQMLLNSWFAKRAFGFMPLNILAKV